MKNFIRHFNFNLFFGRPRKVSKESLNTGSVTDDDDDDDFEPTSTNFSQSKATPKRKAVLLKNKRGNKENRPSRLHDSHILKVVVMKNSLYIVFSILSIVVHYTMMGLHLVQILFLVVDIVQL